MKSADQWLAESLDDNPNDPPEKRVATWRERIVAIQVDAMQAISEDVAMALKRSLARATAQPFVPHDARAMAELHDRVCTKPSGHDGLCDPRERCELDTDGDGNCPIHPTGCPKPVAAVVLGTPLRDPQGRKVALLTTPDATGAAIKAVEALHREQAPLLADHLKDIAPAGQALTDVAETFVPQFQAAFAGRREEAMNAPLCPGSGRWEDPKDGQAKCPACDAVFMIGGETRGIIPPHIAAKAAPKHPPVDLAAEVRRLEEEVRAKDAKIERYAKDIGVRIRLRYPAAQAFALAMDGALIRNSHKGGWGGCTPLWLLKRLRGEIAELEREVRAWKDGIRTRDEPRHERVLREAADVANFAMMITDVIRRAQTGKGLGEST